MDSRTQGLGKPSAAVLAAVLLAVVAAQHAAAQGSTWFGDLQVFGQSALSAHDPVLAASVGMSPDSQVLTGQTQLDLHGKLSFDQGQLSMMDTATWWQGSDGGTLQNDLLQAWVSVTPSPLLTLVVGKQRLPWGTGYAFFPGDRINPPVNPQNRSEGFFGLSATFSPSASFSLTAIVRMDTAFTGIAQLPGLAYATGSDAASSLPFLAPSLHSLPADPWLGVRYALYAEAFLGSLDLHCAVTWQWERVLRPTAGFSLDVLGFILDGAVAVELSNSDLYPEADGSYQSPGFGSAFPLATIGLQRSAATESATVAVTLEYLYDGTGYDASQASRFLDDLHSFLAGGSSLPAPAGSAASAWFAPGEVIPALGRHYAALSMSAAVTSLLSTDAALVVNLQDLSLAVQANLVFTRLEGIDLFTRIIAGWGPHSDTEFGSLPVRLVVSVGAIVHF